MSKSEKESSKISVYLEMTSHLHKLGKDWKVLGFILILLVASISSEPYFYRWLIGSLEQKHGINELFLIIGIWTCVGIFTIFIRYTYGMRILNKAMDDWGIFLMSIMKKMQQLPIEYHRNIQVGEKQKIVDRSAEAVWAVADNLILGVLPQILVFVVLLISGLIIDPFFTFICLLFLPVGILGVSYFGRQAHGNQRVANKKWDRMYDRLMDGIVNLPVIRIFARNEAEYRIMQERLNAGNQAQMSVRKNWSQFNAFGRFFTILAKLITISGGGILMYMGKTDYATFFFIAFTDRIYGPIMEIFNVIQGGMRDIAYYEKAKEVFEMDTEKDTGTQILENMERAITFQNISFCYPSNNREVLSNIDFSINKGERIALIGHTGSGKSTIIQLLMRFYEPSSGKILIDQTDIYDITLESYRQKFAAVFQDTTLFNETIRHNLEYVRDNITEKDLKKACKEANILEFIEISSRKVETQVGERGLKLSGGEKQRIAIARAILANPEILILDEATSALDTKTEKVVQAAFDNLMKGLTSIIIAHRLSTIMSADIIYLMEKGKILAKGTHKELYENSKEYKELVDLQHDGIVCEETEEDEVVNII